MKIFFIIIGTVVFYFVVELGLLYYNSNHTPKLAKIDQSDRLLGSGPVVKYIAAGDSTGVGYGASSFQKTYSYQIAERLALTNTVEYKNISVVGYRTEDVLNNQVQQIINYDPDIVTISMGPNDATHLVSPDKILNNYKNIISKLEQGTHAQIYITDIANFKNAKILPWFLYRLIEHRSAKLNPKLLALENDRVKIIDIHNFGWDKPSYSNRSTTYAADFFHPNDLGYQNWAAAFLNKILK